ncbi:MAG: NUDIX hydrolase [Planctomycetaceae bacterium]|jgi:ADP-ribose pyrophosphatase|nr:NUDIX hydrolase [Planctomycetaceae bacterium]
MDTLYTSRIFKVVRKFITNKNGTQLERQVVIHPGAVVILPILSDGRIVLIRQGRVAVDEDGLIELPAGTMEPGEEPLVTARRELMEETGYRAAELVPALKFYTSPGFVKEEMRLFIATNLTAGPTALDDDEKIEPLLVGLPQAMDMVLSGVIRDAKTIIGILWYNQQTNR